MSRLKCAAGLSALAKKEYKAAARHFLQANFDFCDCPEIISPNNVAMYGGLCALATYDRSEIQKNVISSSSFKLFLELEPQLRDIIFKFYESKYASCLKLLDEIKDNLLLDMYIAPHVNNLYTEIRNRALIQYFSPYLSADMVKMAAAFNRSVPELENEVMQLILDGQIQARIDSHNKVLYAKDTDQRNCTFEKAIGVADKYRRRVKTLFLRAAVLKNQIHVKVTIDCWSSYLDFFLNLYFFLCRINHAIRTPSPVLVIIIPLKCVWPPVPFQPPAMPANFTIDNRVGSQNTQMSAHIFGRCEEIHCRA